MSQLGGAFSDFQEATMRMVFRRAVRRIERAVDSKNSHFEVEPVRGAPRLFVKIIKDKRRYFEAELAVDRFLADHGLSRIPVRQSGMLEDGSFWIAYDWVDLAPFESTAESLRELAILLGQIHRVGITCEDLPLRHFASPPDLALASINLVRETNPNVANRLGRLYNEAMLRWPSSFTAAVCLLHGDFGFRNVGRTPSGELLLHDYEHSSIGPPILEFAKVWDRELSEEPLRRVFLTHYSSVTGVSIDEWYHISPLVRVWGVAGIFPYAAQHNDAKFAAHGYAVLARLEGVLGIS